MALSGLKSFLVPGFYFFYRFSAGYLGDLPLISIRIFIHNVLVEGLIQRFLFIRACIYVCFCV